MVYIRPTNFVFGVNWGYSVTSKVPRDEVVTLNLIGPVAGFEVAALYGYGSGGGNLRKNSGAGAAYNEQNSKFCRE